MTMKRKGSSFIHIELFHLKIFFSCGSSFDEFKNEWKKHVKSEYWSDIDAIVNEDYVEGITLWLPSNPCHIGVHMRCDMRLSNMHYLVHELIHASDFAVNAIAIDIDTSSSEVRSYIAEYLFEKILNDFGVKSK